MSTISSFRSIENKRDVSRDKYCIKNFCEFLREHAMKILISKRKNEIFTEEQQESYENAKICFICKEKFGNKNLKGKKDCKVRYHYHYSPEYRGAPHSKYN